MLEKYLSVQDMIGLCIVILGILGTCIKVYQFKKFPGT